MYSHSLFEQVAVLNDARHLELLREAEEYRLLYTLNEQPKWINPLHQLVGLFTLKLKSTMQPQIGSALVCLALMLLLSGCVPIHPATAATPAGTIVLYQTGFEPSNFAPGTFDGQSGWSQELGRHDGATISTLNAATGVQALHNEGAAMLKLATRPFSGVLTMYQVRYNAIEQHAPIVEIEADVRLDGPSSGDGPGVNANLVAMGNTPYGPAFLAFNMLASDEGVYAIGGARAPAALRTYQHLGLRLDFTHQTAEYFLNGVSFGVAPFRDTKTAVGLFAVRLDLVGDPEVAAQYTASYDNLVVKVVDAENKR